MNLQEDYCSFELSKLLKEKGFKEPCKGLTRIIFSDSDKPQYKVTHQMAMKWLREVHGIHICPSFVCILNGSGDVKSYKWEDSVLKLPQGYIEHPTTGIHDYYDTYEEAVEAAIKYSLENLI